MLGDSSFMFARKQFDNHSSLFKRPYTSRSISIQSRTMISLNQLQSDVEACFDDWPQVGLFVGGVYKFAGLSDRHIGSTTLEFGGTTREGSSISLRVSRSDFDQANVVEGTQVTFTFAYNTASPYQSSTKWELNNIGYNNDTTVTLEFAPVI